MNEGEKQTYYQLLGISWDASREEIKRAYRILAKKYHPDANNDDPVAEEKFKEITEAYEVLSDEERKREYDRSAKPRTKMDSRQPDSAATSGYRYRPKQGFKYRERRFFSILLRTAIYSMLLIFVLSLVFYLYKDHNTGLEDYFTVPQEYENPVLLHPEGNMSTADKPMNDQSGLDLDELGRELILELREKEEQSWREEWTDEEQNSLQRKFQERRMERTYNMRKEWESDKNPAEQDYANGYEDDEDFGF
jgi:curved DNA-binding protein CbpA